MPGCFLRLSSESAVSNRGPSRSNHYCRPFCLRLPVPGSGTSAAANFEPSQWEPTRQRLGSDSEASAPLTATRRRHLAHSSSGRGPVAAAAPAAPRRPRPRRRLRPHGPGPGPRRPGGSRWRSASLSASAPCRRLRARPRGPFSPAPRRGAAPPAGARISSWLAAASCPSSSLSLAGPGSQDRTLPDWDSRTGVWWPGSLPALDRLLKSFIYTKRFEIPGG